MATAANPLAWTPRDGETVHLRRGNPFGATAGRYVLHAYHGEPGDVIVGDPFDIIGETLERGATYGEELRAMEAAGILTPISAAELDRESQLVSLRLAAPKRGANAWGRIAAQHDASALPLFVAVNEPALL